MISYFNRIIACDCHGIGALDNFCDEKTGQCKCDENAFGRRCNECEPGYWNFPNCEPCKYKLTSTNVSEICQCKILISVQVSI